MFKIIKNFNWIILSSFLCLFLGILTFLTFINESFMDYIEKDLQEDFEEAIEFLSHSLWNKKESKEDVLLNKTYIMQA